MWGGEPPIRTDSCSPGKASLMTESARDEAKVLIVERSQLYHDLFCDVLASAQEVDFDMRLCSRYPDAVHRLREENFHVIILGLGPLYGPDMEMVTCLHRRAEDTPIIVLTGLADEWVGKKAVEQGLAQTYLQKGQMSIQDLQAAVTEAVRSQNQGEDGS